MSDQTKFEVLTDIATEILVNELQRRAAAKLMSVDELIEEAQANWEKAEKDADDLKDLGHADE